MENARDHATIRRGMALAATLAAALLATACTRLAPTADAPAPTIGVILPFSSAFTPIAQEQQRAIEMALADAESPARLVFKDGGGDAETAIAAFRELATLEPRPAAVITCASWVASALNPLAAEAGIFHIAIGSAALDRGRPGHTVRFTLDAHMEERQLASYLERFRRIAIFHMDNGYGKNWAKVIAENFAERVAVSKAYDPKADDFRDGLRDIAAAKPDALVLLSAGNAGEIARQAREMGIHAQLVGTRPIERPELLERARYTDGLVYTYPTSDRKHPLVAAYRGAFDTEATIFAAEAYDALTSLLHALDATDTPTPEALFAWYAGRTLRGALGQVRFDTQGDAVYPYMYKQVIDGQFHVAQFQFPMLLEETIERVHHVFHEMHEQVEKAAEALGATGLTGEKAQALLLGLHEACGHSYDCVTIDTRGVIVNAAPESCENVIGADISKQEQVRRMMATRKAVVSGAIDSVEGFVGFDLEHPVFDAQGKFLGAVSVLTEPDFFGKVIRPRVANFPVEMWVMQKDGRIVYDENPEEIGRNLLTGPMYADFPELCAIGRRMAAEPRGAGDYEFLDKGLEHTVKKRVVWCTVSLHGTEFRVALSYVPTELD